MKENFNEQKEQKKTHRMYGQAIQITITKVNDSLQIKVVYDGNDD